MKTALTISLAFLFLAQSFTRSFIYLNYEMNKTYISNVLCVNKERKQVHCEGKCHLKKELQKEEKSEQTPTGSSKEKFEITLFNSYHKAEIIFSKNKTQSLFSYSVFLSGKHIVPVFHPPGLNS